MNTTSLKVSPNTTNGLDGAMDKVADRAGDLMDSKDQVVHDFKALLSEGEALLKSAAGAGDHAFAAARDKFRDQLDVAKKKYSEIEAATVVQAKKAATVTNEYVTGNPWTSVAVAGGIGLLVGMLIMSKREG